MSQKKDFDANEQKIDLTQLSDKSGNEPHREEFRHVLIGSPKVVTSIIHSLKVKGYADVGDWSPLVPNPSNPEQVISIFVRKIMVR